jgi:hypothetical protein
MEAVVGVARDVALALIALLLPLAFVLLLVLLGKQRISPFGNDETLFSYRLGPSPVNSRRQQAARAECVRLLSRHKAILIHSPKH